MRRAVRPYLLGFSGRVLLLWMSRCCCRGVGSGDGSSTGRLLQADAGGSAMDRFLGVVPNRAVHVLGLVGVQLPKL